MIAMKVNKIVVRWMRQRKKSWKTMTSKRRIKGLEWRPWRVVECRIAKIKVESGGNLGED
jgi:hypothetical protein